jgi:outer membrane receptor protein involved in Fe transport
VDVHDVIFLTAGLRAEDNSTFGQDLGTPVLPRAGLSLVRQVGLATIKVRGSYGKALRAPAPGQAFGVVLPSQINLANPLLAPERQQGWDAGIDLVFGNRGSLSVTGYDQTAKDLIMFVQVPGDSLPTFQFQNVGRVANSGIEVEGTLILHRLQLKGQYGYVRSRIEDLGSNASSGAALQVGDRPDRTPKHTAGAAVTLAPRTGTTLTAGLTYVGSWRYTDVLAQLRCFGGEGPCQPTPRDYVVTYPGFAKMNAALTQRVTRQLEGFVSVDNVTNNEAYESDNTVPVMGRITMVGLHVTF